MDDIFNNNKPRSKYLVEHCFKLTLADLGKGLLNGNKGTFALINGMAILLCGYNSNFKNKPRVLIVYRWKGIIRKQTIKLDTETISFGTRAYFQCSCGYRANVLYLRPDFAHYLACRNCLNLKYEITTINRKVLGNELFYRNNRLLKIEEAKAKIKMIHYKDKITKRIVRLAKMYIKWVFDDGAMEKINSQLRALGVR